jgi:hypothetical protein
MAYRPAVVVGWEVDKLLEVVAVVVGWKVDKLLEVVELLAVVAVVVLDVKTVLGMDELSMTVPTFVFEVKFREVM